MATQRTYSPAEVCAFLGIPKSTLLRWERDGVLRRVGRDSTSLRNERRYTLADILVIAGQLREQAKRRYINAASAAEDSSSDDELRSLQEVYLLRRFLAGDVMGVRELVESGRISRPTVRQLLRIAADLYEPGDAAFGEIVHAAAKEHLRVNHAEVDEDHFQTSLERELVAQR